MSTPDHVDQPPRPAPFATTPYGERYLLQSENLRGRQLTTALLHGSSRVWRERRRIWPAALGGLIVMAIIIAAIAVYGAFQRQQEITEQERREREARSAAVWVDQREGAGWVSPW